MQLGEIELVSIAWEGGRGLVDRNAPLASMDVVAYPLG